MFGHASKAVVVVAIAGALCTLPAPSLAQAPADNSKVNKQDQAKGAVTADQQKENVTDRALAQKIRQSIVRDKSLSTYAHNVKIVSRSGQVTLRGPVRSDEEKHTVESKASEIAGAGHVTSELTIAPSSAKPAAK